MARTHLFGALLSSVDTALLMMGVLFAQSYYDRDDPREKEIRDIASEKLRLVGLKGFEDRMPADLSGGMKKRVGLARAIAMDPEIILYDEPTTGLDPIMGDVINKLIVDLKHRLKVTSFTITHDMSSAYQIADTIAMLYGGKIIEQGTPEQIRSTDNPIVRQFVTGAEEGPFQVA